MPQIEDAAEDLAEDVAEEVAPEIKTRDAAEVVSELIAIEEAVAPEFPEPCDEGEDRAEDQATASEPEMEETPAMPFEAEKPQPAVEPSEPMTPVASAGLPPMPETRRATPPVESAPAMPVDVPAPAAGRANRRAGRVKTRLLGFNSAQGGGDPFAAQGAQAGEAQQFTEFPVGWIVVVDGPGRGSAFTIYNGVAQIGRGEGQSVRLDFGDNSISRENHAAIAYDPEQRKFYLGHGGKANLVRLNNRPVLSTEELENGNLIRIGETTIRFVALCGSDFDWSAKEQGGLKHASFG